MISLTVVFHWVIGVDENGNRENIIMKETGEMFPDFDLLPVEVVL
jgi:hypothetical protein